MGLMVAADQLSRNATSCTNVEKCEICKFVQETFSTCDTICLSKVSAEQDQFSPEEGNHLLCPSILKFSTSISSELPMPTFTRSFMKSEQLKDNVIQKVFFT